MEKEELKSKVDDVLGSTQLSLSERTISEELEDALSDVTDDSQVDDKFVNRIANRLKRMSGNLHADVGAESKKYREQFEKDWKEKHPEQNKDPKQREDTKSDIENKLDSLIERMDKADKERKDYDARVKKETALKQIKDGLNDLFKKAKVEPNNYILKQTLRDVEITDDVDVDVLVKKTEKDYYKNLKEAGFETDGKPKGGNAIVADKKMSDDLWSRKAKKEGWGKNG